MSISRRGFVRSVGYGATGVLSLPFIVGRGSEAAAFEPSGLTVLDDVIKISSNENARGPGPSVVPAIREAMTARMGRGYPPDHTEALVTTIARIRGVDAENVIIGTGSGAMLQAGPRAYCTANRPLVTAAPSYGTPEATARQMSVDVRAVPVDSKLGLDLGAMADAARGAGMVFLCNPNNPTGTVHGGDEVEDFVRQVKRTSPETAILIDEAYFEYTHDPAVRTAVPLAMEFPGVFVTRTLSKAHGMAGLRVGYAVGQPETVRRLGDAWNLGSMNTLSAAAAIASLEDTHHIEQERKENARVREHVVGALRSMGYDATNTHTNFIFVALGRSAASFREACLEHGIMVGRDFPPMEQTHSRISLGTMQEMERAVEVFRQVLS